MEMGLEITSFVSFGGSKPSVALVFSNLSSLKEQENKQCFIFEFLQIASFQCAHNYTFPCLTLPLVFLCEA